MQIVVDDDQYSTISDAYLRKVLPAIVRSLIATDLVSFDPHKITETDINIVYRICFTVFANIEDMGGFNNNGRRFVAHLAFAGEPVDPAQLIMSWKRVALHGRLDDEIIIEAIKAAAV